MTGELEHYAGTRTHRSRASAEHVRPISSSSWRVRRDAGNSAAGQEGVDNFLMLERGRLPAGVCTGTAIRRRVRLQSYVYLPLIEEVGTVHP
jgi:hypothetical protein